FVEPAFALARTALADSSQRRPAHLLVRPHESRLARDAAVWSASNAHARPRLDVRIRSSSTVRLDGPCRRSAWAGSYNFDQLATCRANHRRLSREFPLCVDLQRRRQARLLHAVTP